MLISRTRGLPVNRPRNEISARMLSARKRSETSLSFGSNSATSDSVTTVSGQSLIVTPPLMSSLQAGLFFDPVLDCAGDESARNSDRKRDADGHDQQAEDQRR